MKDFGLQNGRVVVVVVSDIWVLKRVNKRRNRCGKLTEPKSIMYISKPKLQQSTLKSCAHPRMSSGAQYRPVSGSGKEAAESGLHA
jgi:hypothetical protein